MVRLASSIASYKLESKENKKRGAWQAGRPDGGDLRVCTTALGAALPTRYTNHNRTQTARGHLRAQEVLQQGADGVRRHARDDVVVQDHARAQALAQLRHADVRAGGGGETNDAHVWDGLCEEETTQRERRDDHASKEEDRIDNLRRLACSRHYRKARDLEAPGTLFMHCRNFSPVLDG